MATQASAAAFLPDRLSLTSLRQAAEECRGCELYRNATQTVFGQGLRRAPVMLVGEIPGDEEDRQGKPFVGPAGRLLKAAMAEAELSLRDVYLTNVVKHFYWKPRGKRRFHKKPARRHIVACMPWLEAEMEVVQPQVIVCLGATAAQSLLGSSFRVSKQRGRFVKNGWAPRMLATYHPSAILRAPTKEDRREQRQLLVADLRLVAKALGNV